jgi:hypothetical protein
MKRNGTQQSAISAVKQPATRQLTMPATPSSFASDAASGEHDPKGPCRSDGPPAGLYAALRRCLFDGVTGDVFAEAKMRRNATKCDECNDSQASASVVVEQAGA